MITYRLAKKTDEEKISVLIALFRVELKRFKGIESKENREWAKAEFNEYMDAGFPIFVAEKDDTEIIGYLVCKIENGVVWAESLFVAPNNRRQNVASNLYDMGEELARKLGNDTLFNWIHPNNENMIAFLESKGYTVLNLIEIRKPYQDELTNRKVIVGQHEYDY